MQHASWPRFRHRIAGVLLVAVVLTCADAAQAQKKGADWTAKLEPRTRTIQLCNFAGLKAFARDKKLAPRADRVLINAVSEPKIEAAQVTGSGGVVRSGHRWFAFTFKCALTADGKQTSGFTYEIGKEIPKAQWDKLGLWQ